MCTSLCFYLLTCDTQLNQNVPEAKQDLSGPRISKGDCGKKHGET